MRRECVYMLLFTNIKQLIYYLIKLSNNFHNNDLIQSVTGVASDFIMV